MSVKGFASHEPRGITEIKVSLELISIVAILMLSFQINRILYKNSYIWLNFKGKELIKEADCTWKCEKRNLLLSRHPLVALSENSSKVTRGKKWGKQLPNWRLSLNSESGLSLKAGLNWVGGSPGDNY